MCHETFCFDRVDLLLWNIFPVHAVNAERVCVLTQTERATSLCRDRLHNEFTTERFLPESAGRWLCEINLWCFWSGWQWHVCRELRCLGRVPRDSQGSRWRDKAEVPGIGGTERVKPPYHHTYTSTNSKPTDSEDGASIFRYKFYLMQHNTNMLQTEIETSHCFVIW